MPAPEYAKCEPETEPMPDAIDFASAAKGLQVLIDIYPTARIRHFGHAIIAAIEALDAAAKLPQVTRERVLGEIAHWHFCNDLTIDENLVKELNERISGLFAASTEPQPTVPHVVTASTRRIRP